MRGLSRAGLLASAAWLPWLIFGLLAGALADRVSPRALLIGSDIVAMIIAGSVPVLAVFNLLTVEMLVTAAFLLGTSAVVFRVTLPRMVIQLVPEVQLPQAVLEYFATESAAAVAGPGIAGFLAQLASAAIGVGLSAVGYLASALFLSTIRPKVRVASAQPEALLTSIRTGLHVVSKDKYLRYFSVLACVQNFGLTGILSLQVVFLADDLEASVTVIGLVVGAGGLGGAIGALAGPSVMRRMVRPEL